LKIFSAQQYIQLTLAACDETINDPQQFPIDEGAKFPRNFLPTVKTIYKRLFRLYAHIYCSHSEHVKSIGANAHINSLFKHFIYFSREFNLLDRQEEQPLQSLIVRMFANDAEALIKQNAQN
jgi:MOB kinase activator 1